MVTWGFLMLINSKLSLVIQLIIFGTNEPYTLQVTSINKNATFLSPFTIGVPKKMFKFLKTTKDNFGFFFLVLDYYCFNGLMYTNK